MAQLLTRTDRSSVRSPIRSVRDSRPPYVETPAPAILPVIPAQPALDLGDSYGDVASLIVHGRRRRPRGTVAPRSGLPDASAWAGSLALALFEALLAQRPVGQLSRWVDDVVLAELSYRQRRVVTGGRRSQVSAKVRSVRAQHPHPEVAEVTATVAVGRRVLALALRLEALGDRWLCTALEVGPRDQGENSSTRPAQV